MSFGSSSSRNVWPGLRPEATNERARPRVGRADACGLGYEGSVLGVTAQNLLDGAHYASAGAVSFARGLNDTPKIAALLLAGAGRTTRCGAWSPLA